MNATTVTALAVLASVVGHWTHNQPSLSIKSAVGSVFLLVFIAALDNGKTAEIAQGLSWIILAAVLLSKNTPLTGITNAINKTPKKG